MSSQQTEKLEMIKKSIRIQEEERELVNSYKVQSIMYRNAAQKDAAIARIEHQRIQSTSSI
jgi:hypothetical protein